MLSRVDKSARFAVFFRQSPGDFLGSRLVFLETTVFRPTKIAVSLIFTYVIFLLDSGTTIG